MPLDTKYYPLEKKIAISAANYRLTSWISCDYYELCSHPERWNNLYHHISYQEI